MEKQINDVLAVLSDPTLFDWITDGEFDKQIVGEKLTRKAIFLSLCSIWVKKGAIHTLVNSESSAGKSYICKKIIDIFPKDNYEYRTKISPEVFTYWHNPKFEPDWTWDGKACYLEDVRRVVLDSETFKIMCSEGSKATVLIHQRPVDIEIKGKPAMLLTTATGMVSNEIINRFNVITMDETVDQTRAIMKRHSELAMKGESLDYDEGITAALGTLKRIRVKIPFAPKIDKYFPHQYLRARRDYPRFLDLIKASCALHQYQRLTDTDPVSQEPIYIAEQRDYELAAEVFPKIQTQMFSLTHKQRKLYESCERYVNNGGINPFSFREIRSYAPISAEKVMREWLDEFAEKGLLKLTTEENERGKDITKFNLLPKTIISSLPKWDDL